MYQCIQCRYPSLRGILNHLSRPLQYLHRWPLHGGTEFEMTNHGEQGIQLSSWYRTQFNGLEE